MISLHLPLVFRLTVVLCREISLLSKKFTSCLTTAGVSGLKCSRNAGNITGDVNLTHTHTHASESHEYTRKFQFCCEDWDLCFSPGKWKGRRPQPADNWSVFRGLCFSFKAAITQVNSCVNHKLWEHSEIFVLLKESSLLAGVQQCFLHPGCFPAADAHPGDLPHPAEGNPPRAVRSWRQVPPSPHRPHVCAGSSVSAQDETFVPVQHLWSAVYSHSNSVFSQSDFCLKDHFLKTFRCDFFSLLKQESIIKYLFLFKLVFRKWCFSLQHIPVPAAIVFPLYFITTICSFGWFFCDSVLKKQLYIDICG